MERTSDKRWSMRQFVKKILDYALKDKKSKKYSVDHIWAVRRIAVGKGIVPYFKRIEYRNLMEYYNASIPLSAEFSDMPIMPHGPYGVFISQGAVIGKKCVIFHQVTIGSNTLPDNTSAGSPKIGDNVYIGCGAKIIGNITVGNNVRIGANCVVFKDIPDNSTVVLPAPRIIVKQNDNNSFIPFSEKK